MVHEMYYLYLFCAGLFPQTGKYSHLALTKTTYLDSAAQGHTLAETVQGHQKIFKHIWCPQVAAIIVQKCKNGFLFGVILCDQANLHFSSYAIEKKILRFKF